MEPTCAVDWYHAGQLLGALSNPDYGYEQSLYYPILPPRIVLAHSWGQFIRVDVGNRVGIHGLGFALCADRRNLAAKTLATPIHSWALAMSSCGRDRSSPAFPCTENAHIAQLPRLSASLLAISNGRLRHHSPLLPLPGGRRLAAARTDVSDCAGFAPN